MKNAVNILCFLLINAATVTGQWSNDPSENTPVSTTPEIQRPPQMVSDGSGGAIVLWEQDSTVADWHIYAQRVDATGLLQWDTAGVAILRLSADRNHSPHMVSDGNGGAIIAWDDLRGQFTDVYVQRIDAGGTVQWSANGVRVTSASRPQYFPSITNDGQGGAIIAYNDNGNELRMQRVSTTGSLMWPDSTVVSTDLRLDPVIIGDGFGGAIVVWEDDRNSGSSASDVYAQRINAAGSPQWATGGVEICSAAGEQTKLAIIADGVGGAIIAWQDKRNGTSDIYAQRISAAGLVQWTTNGIAVVTVPNLYNPQIPRIVSDGAGGAIITWEDRRNGSFNQVYAQRVDNVGMVQWPTNGVLVSLTTTSQTEPAIVSDGAGAYITWSEFRSGGALNDIYAQRINDLGERLWDSVGVTISSALQPQRDPEIVSSGGTGAVIVWRDQRHGLTNPDIYAQRVLLDGTLGNPTLSFVSPVAGDTLIAGERDTIRWRGEVSPVDISLSIDSGRTFQPIALDYSSPSSFYSWGISDTIISRWCVIQVEDANNPLLFVRSGVFLVKGYQLHRFAADGNYERFRFERDRWNFGNVAVSMWPMAWYSQFNYQTSIDPYTGLPYPGIPPFSLAVSSDFPDWPLFASAYGVPQCYFIAPFMTYRNVALNKWNATKKAWAGSCSGFSLSALLAFDDSATFRQGFPTMPPFEDLLSVPLGNAVRSIINELGEHWFGTQHRGFSATARLKRPTQTIHDLKRMLWSDTVDHSYLYFRNNGIGGGAHAVVPTKVVRDPANPSVYWIHVYDNSYHNVDTARISVDTSANGGLGVWNYSLWPGWGGNRGLYLMDKASTYLSTPILGRALSMFVPASSSNTIEVFPTLDASVVITDPTGNRVGYSDSLVLDEIPEAVPFIPPTGSKTPPYSYYLTDGLYSLVMDDFADSVAQLSLFTDSTVFTYRRLGATLTQTDRFTYDGSLAMRNIDPLEKSITVNTIFVIDSTAEKTYTISDCALTPNDSMQFSKAGDDDYKIVNDGLAKTYGLRIEYGSATGSRLFIRPVVNLTATSSHVIVPNWNNFAEPVKIYIDHGNNGTIDDSIFVQNTVDVEERPHTDVPMEFTLSQNYPNPFNASTKIRVGLPKGSFVSLKVYNILGQEVATLVNNEHPAGYFNAEWNGRNRLGSEVASGIYFYHVEAKPTDGSAPFVSLKKMLMVK